MSDASPRAALRRRQCLALAGLGVFAGLVGRAGASTSIHNIAASSASAAPDGGAGPVRMGGTGSAMAVLAALARAHAQAEAGRFLFQVVPNLGSGGGVKAVSLGAVQLAASGRSPTAAERTAGLRAMPLGSTPFVVASAHPGVQGLTREELAALYAGHQARWADGQAVRLVLRPASDVDTELLASFSPAVRAALASAMARPGMLIAMTDQDSADAIERLPGGLGTSSLALLQAEQRRARPLALDGVAPTLANLASGRYPWAKRIELIWRGEPSPALRGFLDHVASPAGQRLLLANGILPAGVVAPPDVVAPAAPAPPRPR